MKDTASDTILWWPNDRSSGPQNVIPEDWLVHVCPTAVIGALTTRETLDPMALGECRYCSKPMPTWVAGSMEEEEVA